WLAGAGNEGLMFYGSTTSSLYQAGNLYQLEVGLGSVIAQDVVAGTATTNDQAFLENIYFEHDEPYVHTSDHSWMPPLDDFWVWDYWWDSGASKNFTLNLPDVDINDATGIVTTSLKGWYKENGLLSNNHVRVSCNGVLVSDIYFTGWDRAIIQSPVTNLVSGNNTISIEQLWHTNSVIFLESFDVSYSRQFTALNDALIFDGGAYSNITVSGFSTNQVMLFDITDENSPVQLSGSSIGMDSNGLFAISFIPQASAKTYLATIAPFEVASMNGFDRVDLLSTTNSADYIVITVSDFLAAAQPLIDQREAQGLKTMLLDVDQVYDIFSDGFVTPDAIKDLLIYAYSNWVVAPRYVVIAGTGSFDFRDKNQDDPASSCLIPPLMYYIPIDDSAGWVGVDAPFGDVEGDAVPEIIVGRLSVKDTTELSDVVAKIIAYEELDSYDWKSRVLLLADDKTESTDKFQEKSDILATLIPSNRPTDKVYLVDAGDAGRVQNEVIDFLNAGTGFLTYMGHGNRDKVAAEDL
ncbi:MAG: hypothetical protein KAI74_01535, partial [Kiritimatiellae bacterium]|nr:hypothetical protein [Kiritimatiellia bacterium]